MNNILLVILIKNLNKNDETKTMARKLNVERMIWCPEL
jgi:hypothetical protein